MKKVNINDKVEIKKENIFKNYDLEKIGKYIINEIKQGNGEIIFFTLDILEKRGIDFLKTLNKKNNRQIISIITVDNEKKSVLDMLYKNEEILRYQCNNLIISKKINQELEKLKFNMLYNGTKYLADSIYMLYLNKETDFEKLSKTIYPIIAKREKKSVDTIYGNIKHAVNCMFFDCDEKILKQYFKYDYVVKPKPKEVISYILNKL